MVYLDLLIYKSNWWIYKFKFQNLIYSLEMLCMSEKCFTFVKSKKNDE